MKLSGRIQNGVVAFDEAPSLPEGTEVMVVIGSELVIRRAQNRKHVELPLVPSADPGSVHLTNEMIGQILDDEDAARGWVECRSMRDEYELRKDSSIRRVQ